MNILFESLSITLFQAIMIAALGFFIGIDKMGLRGGPVIFVPFFATIFGARFTSGLVVPLLLFADILAVIIYRRYCNWKLFGRVFLWMLLGIGIGAVAGKFISESLFRIFLGVILLMLLALMVLLESRRDRIEVPDRPWITGPLGTLAGFSSMIGNAAGPVVSLFLLAKRLSKDLFLGTSAMIFLAVNASKLPFHIFLWKTVNPRSLGMGVIAIPFILLGVLLGKPLVKLIPEKAFRYFIMTIALLGALQLFFGR